MSLNRYAKKRDAAEPAIIQALEAAKFEVWVLDQPSDLAVRHTSWPGGLVQLLEVKTAHGKRQPKPREDKRQAKQRTFLASSGTPIVTTPMEALRALGAVT